MYFSELEKLIANSPLQELSPFLQADFLDSIRHGDHRRWQRLVSELPELVPEHLDFGPVIEIGSAAECSEDKRQQIHKLLFEFMPWRKGPFRVFGVDIDSEWQSNLKWDRLADAIAPLEGRTVLDVGSGNGYSSLRMHAAGARLVIGLEPHIPYYGQFSALKHFIQNLPVYVLPLALEALPRPLPCFDTVFSMGVIYHRRSPLDHLLQLADCLRPGGQLVMESIVVDGEKGYSLMPEARYANMGNVWFIPSVDTLQTWLEKCEFQNVRLVDVSTTSHSEQRQTEWMPFDSLQQALSDKDPSVTVEGYPAPQRAIFLCEKA